MPKIGDIPLLWKRHLVSVCRTFITEALATGVALKDVQVQVGHACGETTLRFAQPVDAQKLHVIGPLGRDRAALNLEHTALE